ncbi:MAG: Mur ligase family protein [Patescibacteria group bacterium]
MNNEERILFIKKAPPIKIIGVIGDEGKTTTAYMIYELLKDSYPFTDVSVDNPSVFLFSEEKNCNLLLKKIKREDIIIIEFEESNIKEFDELGINIDVIVCVSISDKAHRKEQLHIQDKTLFLKRQTSNNFLVIGEDNFSCIKKSIKFGIKSKVIFKGAEDLPREWNFSFKGYHNRENMALALGVAEIFKVSEEMTKNAIEKIIPLSDRLQYIKTINGVEIYNDAFSKTPMATLTALRTLSQNKNIILIMGGNDNGFDIRFLLSHVNQYCSGVVLIAGIGTSAVHKDILSIVGITHEYAHDIGEAVKRGMDMTREGDVLLFSPAFGCKSESNRSEEFLKYV